MDCRSQILCNNYQKSIYHHWKQNRFSEIYHLPMAYEIKGILDITLLVKSFQRVFSSQFAFGLKFREGSANEVACMYDAACLPAIQQQTITGDNQQHIDYQIDLYKAKFFLRPFDLCKGKNLHIDLVKINNTNNHLLLINCHSIICDAHILQEITGLVSRFYKNKETPVEKGIGLNQKKYIALNQYTMQLNNKAIAFIQNNISKLPSLSLLCLDLLPANQAVSINNLIIDHRLKTEIERFCQHKKIQPYIFYLGCYQVLLNKVFQKENLCTGISIPNRPKKLFRDVMGYFVNTLPVISVVNQSTVIDDLLHHLNINVFNIIKHKSADLQLRDESAVTNSGKTFDNTFSFIDGASDLEIQNCTVSRLPVTKRHLDCPLKIEVKQGSGDVQISFINDSSIFLGMDIKNAFLKIIEELLQPGCNTIQDISFENISDLGSNKFSTPIQSAHIGGQFGSIAFQAPEKVA